MKIDLAGGLTLHPGYNIGLIDLTAEKPYIRGTYKRVALYDDSAGGRGETRAAAQ